MRGKIHPMMCLDNDLQYDDHPDLNHYRMMQGNYSFCQLYFFHCNSYLYQWYCIAYMKTFQFTTAFLAEKATVYN